MNAIIALIAFVIILAALKTFYSKYANMSFWKLVAKFPQQALEFVSTDPAWLAASDHNQISNKDYVGPFLFAVPDHVRVEKFYARKDKLEESQKRFMERYGDLVPNYDFPYLSLLALLYPIAAILWLYNSDESVSMILGYGFSNLGYLLGVAFIYPGHFRILNLDSRISAIFYAVLAFVLGFILINFV